MYPNPSPYRQPDSGTGRGGSGVRAPTGGRDLALTRTAPPESLTGPSPPSSLIAAMAFLDGVSRVGGVEALASWLAHDVVLWGWAEPRTAVREHGHAPLPLSGSTDRDVARRLLDDARRRTVAGLRTLVAVNPDDSLPFTLIQRGLVTCGVGSRWQPRVGAHRDLSELVLALIVADMLGRREIYRDRLCVCSVCDRVSFSPGASGRLGCFEHKHRGR